MMEALEESVRKTYETITNLLHPYVSFESVQDLAKDIPRWAWVASAAIGFSVCFKLHYDWHYGVWKRQNIPGPTPLPVLGNNHLLSTCKNLHELNIDLCSKYGEKGYFGCYGGSTPLLVVTDPEIIREVMIKKFENFSQRSSGYISDIPYLRKIISVLPYKEWKRTRTGLSPTFTGAKLKNLVSIINDVGENFSRKLALLTEVGNNTGIEVELKPLFRAYTMDIICNLVFGLKVDTQSDPENEVAKLCFKMIAVNEGAATNPAIVLAFLFPVLKKILMAFSPNLGLNVDLGAKAAEEMKALMKERSEGKMDSEGTFFLTTLVEMVELHHRTNGSDGIDFETAAAQAMIFLLAGFDTTSNLLLWASYYLALYPHMQEKVRKEIETVMGPSNKRASYEDLNYNLKYLDNVLMETLRLRPVFRIHREASCDTTIGPGIKVKAGYLVEVPPNVVHMDPSIWDKPQEFRPSRFEAEEARKRSPYAFNSFGLGPRNCMGMRFALMEAKMAIIALVMDYQLELGENTPVEITEFNKNQFVDPVHPIKLKMSKR